MRAERWFRAELFVTSLAATLLSFAPEVTAEPVFPVVDLHVDLPFQAHFRKKSPLDSGQASAKALLAGHVEGLVLPLFVPERLGVDPTQLDAVFATTNDLRRRAPFALLPGDTSPRTHAWLSIEGARVLSSTRDDVAAWIDRGVRVVGPIHFSDSTLGGASTGKGRAGLTDAGKELSRLVLKKGALLDASHASDLAFDDLLALASDAKSPLLATHSSAKALTSHPRNLDDDRLRALAATGGVVGVNFHDAYVARKGPASLADVVAHLDHLVAVCGEDAVAIGSDYAGDIHPAAGLPTAASYPALASALLASGWTEARVRKVFSANARRVLGPPLPALTPPG